jgi:phage/plasmid-like protein (TIGR03299 family)
MPANVETMAYNSVNGMPWHGLGVPVDGTKTSEEMLVKSGLNWTVSMRNLKMENSDGTLTDVPWGAACVRDSDNLTLGLMTKSYKPIQNWQAFAFTDDLLGEGVRYETAGCLVGGKDGEERTRKVWILASMDSATIKVGKDKIEPYLCFTNGFDTYNAVRVMLTPVRVVCQNTLTMAIEGAPRIWSTKHVGNIEKKMEDAKLTLGLTRQYMEILPEKLEEMIEVNMYVDEFDEFLINLFPDKDGDKANENVLKMRELVKKCHDTKNDIAKFRETKYGVYMAVTDVITHLSPMRKTDSFQENHFMNLMAGHPVIQRAQVLLKGVKK